MLTEIRNRLRQDAGVSMVELLVVIVLMALIGGVLTTSIANAFRAQVTTQSRFEALGELQKAVDRMSRDLRAADPVVAASSDGGSVAVETYQDAAFSQRARFTYVYCATPSPGRIHVWREAAPASPPPAVDCATTTLPVLIDQIVNAEGIFTFNTATGAAPETPQDVSRIRVSVQRRVAGSATPVTVTTTVKVRNVR